MLKRFSWIVKILFLFLVVVTGVLFFDLKKAEAADYQLVINEAYPNPNTGEVEWIELYNPDSQPLSLANYTISDGTTAVKSLSSYNISAGGYLVLSKGIDFSFELNNSGDIIKLKESGNLVDQVAYGNWDDGNTADNASVPLKGQSIARIPNGYDSDSDNLDFAIQTQPTSGTENPNPVFDAPILSSPLNNSVITGDKEIEFDYEFGPGLQDKLIISKYSDLSNPLTDIGQLDWSKYYWAVEISRGTDKKLSEIWSFELKDYSNAIIISEIMPNPIGDDTAGEWIELFNNSAERVNLKGWIFRDSGTTSHPIENDLYIEPWSCLVIYRSQSGLTLNNEGDEVKLYQPNDVLLSSTSFASDGDEGWSWARGPDGVWGWTDEPTAGAVNIIHLNNDSGGSNDNVDNNQPVNSEPIEIPTGDFQNYENYLVTVMGEVTETSGDTFYLDDGTGVIKIYIQKKTGISKPEMHKGDIFLITGLVDLYGTTWRILPRTIDDIRLVQSKATVTKNVAKKKTVAAKVASSIGAKNLVGKVKAASTENTNSNENQTKTSFWLQLLKLITSLAVIFMILLVVKVLRTPRPKIIGGNFGEDET